MRDPIPPARNTGAIAADVAIETWIRQRRIGEELRCWYAGIVTERVPDELLELIAHLERERPKP